MATECQDANDQQSPKEATDPMSPKEATELQAPKEPKQPKASKRSKSSNAKEGSAETKESKPKGSGRADCLCSVCNRMLPLSEFSGSQKKKKRNSRKCLTCALLPVVPGASAPRTPRTRKKAESGDDDGSGSGTDDAADENNPQLEDNSGSETDDEAAAAAKAAAKAAKSEKKKKKKKRGGERKETDGSSSSRGHKKSKSSSAPDDAADNHESTARPTKAARESSSYSSSAPVGRIRNPADERLLRLKPTQPWTAGIGTWPWALAGNGSMPELYPGLPLWVENVEEFVQALGGGLLPAEELDSYKRHTQRSTHFSALLDAYRDTGGLDTKRGSDEHEQLLRSCGWAIRAEEMEIFLKAKDITGRQLLSSSWFELDFNSGVSFPADRQRRCEFCGDSSFCACACGTPYCSRLCQRSDWKGHRSYCLSAALHNELGLTCTKMWWSKRGVGMVVERKPDSK